MVPTCAERRGQTDNQATTPSGYCPSMAFLNVWPHCANARRHEDLNSLPLENWRPLGRPHTVRMKTMQQDLKSNKFCLNEAMAQNGPLWRLTSTFGLVMHAITGEESDLT